LSMADRIVVLSEGRVLQTGTPREIYERPVSPLVALQLGQPAINLLPVRRHEGQWVSSDGTRLMPAEAAGEGERLLGVRPEDISVERSELAFGAHSSAPEAVLELSEYIGPSTTLVCSWAGAKVHVVVPRRAPFRVGERLRLTIDARRALCFAADSNAKTTSSRPQGPPSAPPLKGGSA